MYTEPAPTIPRDAPIAAVSPAVATPVAVQDFASQSLPTDSMPIDRQLWDQVRELRGETEAEPMQLRFDALATTAEPALRFTPRQTAPSEDNPLVLEAMNSFQGLLPSDQLSPADFKGIEELESAFPNWDDAPQPVWAKSLPAYRNDAASAQGNEGGLTFQNRINSEVSRSPSQAETYTVQQGDTYMTISDKFYGTSLLYSALAQHNQKLGIGWRPTEGVAIEIPTAEYLRTNYGESANRQERLLESQRSAIRYIVQEGDTIFRLATDRLQDSTRWREIYALNVDRLQDVRDLKPGMEILLPVETARVNQQQIR